MASQDPNILMPSVLLHQAPLVHATSLFIQCSIPICGCKPFLAQVLPSVPTLTIFQAEALPLPYYPWTAHSQHVGQPLYAPIVMHVPPCSHPIKAKVSLFQMPTYSMLASSAWMTGTKKSNRPKYPECMFSFFLVDLSSRMALFVPKFPSFA